VVEQPKNKDKIIAKHPLTIKLTIIIINYAMKCLSFYLVFCHRLLYLDGIMIY